MWRLCTLRCTVAACRCILIKTQVTNASLKALVDNPTQFRLSETSLAVGPSSTCHRSPGPQPSWTVSENCVQTPQWALYRSLPLKLKGRRARLKHFGKAPPPPWLGLPSGWFQLVSTSCDAEESYVEAHERRSKASPSRIQLAATPSFWAALQ